MAQNLRYVPERQTDFTIRLAVESTLDVLALVCVGALVALAVWWFASRRRR